jgi:dCTP deaminase
MVLSDVEITARLGMIDPFVDGQVRSDVEGKKVISYGVSSYGYDARLADEFKIFCNSYPTTVIDPKNFDERAFIEHQGDHCIIPPNSFVLGRTVERFKIPRDLHVICIGKSTYARCGIIVNVTPLEPEWEGHVTMEISNTAPLPAKIYANEGICQFLFMKTWGVCKTSYADRNGKYQGAVGIGVAKV